MRTVMFAVLASAALGGCALSPQQAAERAKLKSNSELCMATIQFPQYGDAIAQELADRKHTCDWALTAAQIGAANEKAAAFRRAVLQPAATSSDTQSSYQIVPPVELHTRPPLQLQPLQLATVTAHWTGRQHQVQTVTYQFGWNCEYNYAGGAFWRTFVGSCPSSVQVQ